MKDAKHAPIRWKSPNGTQQTAIRIPRSGTIRLSFRKSAQQSEWIEHVVDTNFNKEKVSVEWLWSRSRKGFFESVRCFISVGVRTQGLIHVSIARMPKEKTAAVWTAANLLPFISSNVTVMLFNNLNKYDETMGRHRNAANWPNRTNP